MIDVVILGTAAMTPLPRRRLSAMLLRHHGRQILVDCGEGTQVAIKEFGYGLKSIDGIAITHFHGDHYYGLPGLLESIEFAGREEFIWIAGPEGLDRTMDILERMNLDLPFELHAYEESVFESSGLRIETFPLKHPIPAQGYVFVLERPGKFDKRKALEYGIAQTMWSRLQAGETIGNVTPDMVMGPKRRGLKIVYASDSSACKSIVEASEGADLLVIEGTYPDFKKKELADKHGHMNFLEAAEIAKRAGVKEAWLTHFSHSMKDPEEHIQAAREIFPNLYVAFDGMKKTLSFESD